MYCVYAIYHPCVNVLEIHRTGMGFIHHAYIQLYTSFHSIGSCEFHLLKVSACITSKVPYLHFIFLYCFTLLPPPTHSETSLSSSQNICTVFHKEPKLVSCASYFARCASRLHKPLLTNFSFICKCILTLNFTFVVKVLIEIKKIL
jgi:hypothetical protein